MSTPLRDALEDLVTDVAVHVVPEDLGPRAWASGRRRRWRRRIVPATVVVAAATLAVAVTPLTGELRSGQAAADRDRGVGGYPVRIGHQWWTRALPDRPGAVAALVQAGPDNGPLVWYGVSETGHHWRLPDTWTGEDHHPAISRDGLRIGYLLGRHGPYVIHDLGAGTRTTFAAVGGGTLPIATPYYVEGQSPSFWSPDGRRVAQNGALRDLSTAGAVVLSIDGSLAYVRKGEGSADNGFIAGWVGDDALLWVKWWPPGENAGATATVVATVTGLDGAVRHTVMLHPNSPWLGDFGSQWAATISPDAGEVLVIDESSGEGAIRRFALADGRETAPPMSIPDLAMPCGADWAGSEPTVQGYDHSAGAAFTAVWRGGEFRTAVTVEPGVGARCLVWASDALSGKAHGSFLGTTTAWWSWWLREIAAALGLAAAATGALLSRRRFRRAAAGRETG
jgi:hypothetical protein